MGWLTHAFPRPHTLVMRADHWRALRDHLFLSDTLERAAVGLLGASRCGRELFLHRLELPADLDCSRQTPTFIELAAQYTLDRLSDYVASDAVGLMYAHSHPFCDHAAFSAGDDRFHPRMAGSLASALRARGLGHEIERARFLRLVVGQAENGFSAEVLDVRGKTLGPVSTIRLVDASGWRTLRPFRTPLRAQPVEKPLQNTWSRNVAWMGEAGQRRLAQTRLAIAGTGGVGALALQSALGLGFREIILIDHDTVEPSNLNRLIGVGPAQLGWPKVVALAKAAAHTHPRARITAIPEPVAHPEAQCALARCDVWFCGVDDDEARLMLQVQAARQLRPLLDVGSGFRLDAEGRVSRMGGQVRYYAPGGPCLACQGLDPSRIESQATRRIQRAVGYVVGTELTPAAAITVNGVMVSAAMDLLVRALTGFAPHPHHLQVDLLSHHIRPMAWLQKPSCSICGSAGVEGLGQGRTRLLPSPTRRPARLPLSGQL